MKEKLKRTEGITLIALVITIIVLLILAGVTIATLTGENGILTKAEDAKLQTEIAREKEEIAVAYNGAKVEKNGEEVIGKDMNDQFDKNGTKAKARGNTTITVKFTDSGRIYEIYGDGNITESTTEWKEYTISATMTQLYKYYVEGDTANGYQLKNDGSDCISIESKDELKYLSEYTNLNNQTENVTFVILNDINLNEGITFGEDGSIIGGTPEKWAPMGKMEQVEITSRSDWDSKVAEYKKLYSSTKYMESYSSWTKNYYYIKTSFKGKIDGQGYMIEGLYAEGNEAGLVGVLESGTIENLTMSSNYLLAGESSGILVGKVVGEETDIKNIESKNNYIIADEDYVGGICGAVLDGNVNCENSHSDNTIIFKADGGDYGIGGIVGTAGGENMNILNCSNSTDMIGGTSKGLYVGSIAGMVGDCMVKNAIFNNCYNDANIEGYGSGQGGIVGESTNDNIVISNCYNTGDIGGEWGTGGIAGWEASDYCKIYNCYNTGKIYNNEDRGGDFGGIIGQCRAELTMYNCYNTGEIYASEENYIYGGDVGGLIGQNNEGTIYNCYNVGKINLYVHGDAHTNTSGELGIGGLFGNAGSEWGDLKVSNCYNICEVVLNYPANENVERSVYFGNIVGSVLENTTVENCYGYSIKTINLPENACGFGQNIGAVEQDNTGNYEGTKVLTGYTNKNDGYPSVGYKSEYITQNIQEVETYQSQEFCDMLNSWVNSNNDDGKYSIWKYNANKNEGYPYLECSEEIIK